MGLRRTPMSQSATISTILASTALHLAHTVGITSPFGILVLGGAFFRALTHVLTLYGDQCLARMALAMPELYRAHQHYVAIAEHPKAIHWERKVAAQKLKSDRNRLFRAYHTNNLKLFLPHVAAVGVTFYMFGMPSHLLFDALGAEVPGALVVSASPPPLLQLPLPGLEKGVDLTLAFAAGISGWNLHCHLQRRRGFNDGMDDWARGLQRRTAWGAAVVAGGSLLLGLLEATRGNCPAAGLLGLPPYLGPVWFGMALITLGKTLCLNETRPGRALARLPEPPPTHGSYGAVDTAAGHEYRLEFDGADADERRARWGLQKRVLEYEFDRRLHRYLAKTRLFSELDEIEMESERLRDMRMVAHARRRQAEVSEQAPDEAAGQEKGAIRKERLETLLSRHRPGS